MLNLCCIFPTHFHLRLFLNKSARTVTVNRAKIWGKCVIDALAENRGILKAKQIMPQSCSCTFFQKKVRNGCHDERLAVSI